MHYSPHVNYNDIALFELDTIIKFSYNVSAVKLPFDTGDCVKLHRVIMHK